MKTIIAAILVASLAWWIGIEAAKLLNQQEEVYKARRHDAEFVEFPAPGDLASK